MNTRKREIATQTIQTFIEKAKSQKISYIVILATDEAKSSYKIKIYL